MQGHDCGGARPHGKCKEDCVASYCEGCEEAHRGTRKGKKGAPPYKKNAFFLSTDDRALALASPSDDAGALRVPGAAPAVEPGLYESQEPRATAPGLTLLSVFENSNSIFDLKM